MFEGVAAAFNERIPTLAEFFSIPANKQLNTLGVVADSEILPKGKSTKKLLST